MFAAEVAALWASPRVHPTLTPELLGAPDVVAPGLRVVHRRTADAHVYLISNPKRSAVRVAASVRVAAEGAEWWDPVTGERRVAGARRVGDRTALEIELPAFGSGALVLRAARDLPAPGDDTVVATATATTADDGSTVTTSWTATVEIPADAGVDARLLLRLGDVRDIAEVFVDGRSAGVAWTAPFEVDATGALTPGRHAIEVRVTTGWANRLIRDAAHPDEAITQLTAPIYAADAPTLPWGLGGAIDVIRRPIEVRSTAVTRDPAA